MIFFSFSNYQEHTMKMTTLTDGCVTIQRQSVQTCALTLSGLKWKFQKTPEHFVEH